MFTGIIQSVGSVTAISFESGGARLCVDLNQLDLERVRIGDSIAVNGACLTTARIEQNVAQFDISAETLEKCLIAQWATGDQVNLELALTLQTPIGGHLVSGHVDGFARFIERRDTDEFTTMQFETNIAIGKFIAIKGSIAIDGVSLTTNNVQDKNSHTLFDVTLVPHTLKNTILGTLATDASVHIEVDLIARYIHRIRESGNS